MTVERVSGSWYLGVLAAVSTVELESGAACRSTGVSDCRGLRGLVGLVPMQPRRRSWIAVWPRLDRVSIRHNISVLSSVDTLSLCLSTLPLSCYTLLSLLKPASSDGTVSYPSSSQETPTPSILSVSARPCSRPMLHIPILFLKVNDRA